MKFEIRPCSENDAEFIEEQAEKVFNTAAPPEPDAEEEAPAETPTPESEKQSKKGRFSFFGKSKNK